MLTYLIRKGELTPKDINVNCILMFRVGVETVNIISYDSHGPAYAILQKTIRVAYKGFKPRLKMLKLHPNHGALA